MLMLSYRISYFFNMIEIQTLYQSLKLWIKLQFFFKNFALTLTLTLHFFRLQVISISSGWKNPLISSAEELRRASQQREMKGIDGPAGGPVGPRGPGPLRLH